MTRWAYKKDRIAFKLLRNGVMTLGSFKRRQNASRNFKKQKNDYKV